MDNGLGKRAFVHAHSCRMPFVPSFESCRWIVMSEAWDESP